MKYLIKIQGCDDQSLVMADLTDEQVAFLTQIGAQVEAIRGGPCKPTLSLVPEAEISSYDREELDDQVGAS